MGASFLYETMPGTATKEEVKERFASLRADGEFEDGHSYSGNWNMVHVITFESADSTPLSCQAEAETRVQEKSRKWENAHAVQFFNLDPASLKLPAKYTKIRAQLAALTGPSRNAGPYTESHDLNYFVQQKLREELMSRIKSSKTQFRGCPSCSSRISIKHLKNLNCPVCGHDFLVTDTDKKKIQAQQLKAQSLVKELSTLYKQAQEKQKHILLKNPANLQWYLGAWCAS